MDIVAQRHSPRLVPYTARPPLYRAAPINHPVFEEREHVVVRIVSFAAGGYELTARTVDVQSRADRAAELEHCRRRGGGKRKPVDERSEIDKARAARRAKQMVRHLCRQVGCQYLMTLTTREERNTPEEMAERWRKFVRLLEFRTGRKLVYVAVPERHPSNPNHWHLHVALPGFVHVNVARPLWWSCCGGRGQGNIDVKYIKVRQGLGVGERARRVAMYLSKYMTKELLAEHRPDKKNYWRSRFAGPEQGRCYLEARPGDLAGQLMECIDRFGMVPGGAGGVFIFPDGSGFWYSHTAGQEHPSQAPPF